MHGPSVRVKPRDEVLCGLCTNDLWKKGICKNPSATG
jgi:hypothetical protein